MNRRREYLLMLPGIAGFMLFYLFPLCLTCLYVFIRSPFDTSFVGLTHLIKTASSINFQMALWHTACFTFISVASTLMLSIILTFLFFSCRFLFYAPFVLPVLLPTVAVTMVWRVLFGNDSLFATLGIPSQIALYALFSWKNTGLYMLFLLAALSQIPKEMLEAASMDGAGAFRSFFFIILPHLMSTLFFCCVYAIMCSFRIFREAYLLYGIYPDEKLFMTQHYIYIQFTKLHYPEVASAGFLYAIPIVLLVFLLFHSQNKLKEEG